MVFTYIHTYALQNENIHEMKFSYLVKDGHIHGIKY